MSVTLPVIVATTITATVLAFLATLLLLVRDRFVRQGMIPPPEASPYILPSAPPLPLHQPLDSCAPDEAYGFHMHSSFSHPGSSSSSSVAARCGDGGALKASAGSNHQRRKGGHKGGAPYSRWLVASLHWLVSTLLWLLLLWMVLVVAAAAVWLAAGFAAKIATRRAEVAVDGFDIGRLQDNIEKVLQRLSLCILALGKFLVNSKLN